METFFYPMAVVLFLIAVYAAQKKESWSWLNVIALAASLMLLTYSYTIGRLLGPLLAGGLILFATSQPRIISLVKTWALFALTLIPLLIFRSKNPEALTQRFYLISYIKPDTPLSEIIPKFFHRYLEDLSLISLLFDGDGNPRHHVYGSLGAFLIGAYQEILGDLHNLFGDTNTVHVDLTSAGEVVIEAMVKGDTVREVLDYVEFEPSDLITRLQTAVETAVRENRLSHQEAGRFLKFYEEALNGYTYLEEPGD